MPTLYKSINEMTVEGVKLRCIEMRCTNELKTYTFHLPTEGRHMIIKHWHDGGYTILENYDKRVSMADTVHLMPQKYKKIIRKLDQVCFSKTDESGVKVYTFDHCGQEMTQITGKTVEGDSISKLYMHHTQEEALNAFRKRVNWFIAFYAP